MPRDGSDVYNVPSGTYGIEDTTIESARYNAFVDDVAQDLNHPRPILSGGTGATNAFDALNAVGGEAAQQLVVNYDSDVLRAGSIYSASTATNPPVAGHAFVGFVYLSDANNMMMQVRDQNDTVTPGRMYVREKKAGVWGAWHGAGEGGSSNPADMSYGLTGTSPNSQFVVNNKADGTGTNLLTVRKSDNRVLGVGLCPSGALMDFAMTAPPAGWLVCDGSSQPTATYPDLFLAIGYTWGGSGANFNLPNLVNRFRRHAGPLAGAVGALQNPANKAHAHQILLSSTTNAARTGAADRLLNHQHTVTTGNSNQNLSHHHPYTMPSDSTARVSGTGNLLLPTYGSNNTGDTDLTAHTHTGTTDVSQGGVDHLHLLDLNFNSQGGAGDDANEARPYSATVLTCIKT